MEKVYRVSTDYYDIISSLKEWLIFGTARI